MVIDPGAASLRDRLRWRLVAAAATPGDATGRVDEAILAGYLDGLVADGADGLAVCVHTGRGPYLPRALRRAVVSRAVATGVPVIVGVGGGADSQADILASAADAAAAGCEGLLVFPPEPGIDPVPLHDALWQATRLPMLVFDLYASPYPLPALEELLTHPGVAGVKVARLDDALGCQAAIAAAQRADRLPVTGEDRMFGPSLMWGAQAALVGIAAAAVDVTAKVLRAFAEHRYADFVAASARLDRLAEVTFTEPMDGYIQRMLWIAAAEGRVPEALAHDPHAPELPAGDRARVLARVDDAHAPATTHPLTRP